MPKISVSVLPEAATACGAAAAVFEQGAIDAADVGDQLAGDRLAFEVDGAGGPDRRRAGARRDRRRAGAGRRRGAGRAAARCSRLTVRRRSPVSSSRRSESSRNTAVWSSARDREQVAAVLGDEATLRASMPSVLRPWPRREHAGAGGQRGRDVDDGLAGGDELLGEQPSRGRRRPRSPRRAAASRRPRSQAGRASTCRRRRAARRAWRRSASSATAVCEALCGSMPIVTTGCAPSSCRDGRDTAAGNLSSSTAITPLSSHANGGRRPRGTL